MPVGTKLDVSPQKSSKRRCSKVGIAPGWILTVAVVVEVQQLVAPLGDDTERILEERDNDQETANGWEIPRSMRGKVSRHALGSSRILTSFTYGLTGSLNESSRSSTLLV